MTVPAVTLRDGNHIPQLGLGTFKVAPSMTKRVVSEALEIGYRHFDTARIYDNEAEVGAALRASGIGRQELFVTTKLWNEDQGTESAFAAFDRSLEKLGLDYVDLYLVHWPAPARERYVESWRALEQIAASGRARSIGVSNFMVEHLKRLEKETSARPVINQIELHPAHQQPEVTAYCEKMGIAIESWGPLGQGKYDLLDLPEITGPAREHGKTPAQVVLRWHLQRGFIVFPKSVHRERMAENFDLFDFALTEEQMRAISALERAGRVSASPYELN